jgi:hypothetical protein
MANPNIVAVTKIYGTTTYFTPSGTTAVVLLNNTATSGKVFKVVSQGSAPSGGTAFPVINTVSVPAYASLIAVDKTTAIYLMEGQSISITSGTGSALSYSISYEDITDQP